MRSRLSMNLLVSIDNYAQFSSIRFQTFFLVSFICIYNLIVLQTSMFYVLFLRILQVSKFNNKIYSRHDIVEILLKHQSINQSINPSIVFFCEVRVFIFVVICVVFLFFCFCFCSCFCFCDLFVFLFLCLCLCFALDSPF